MKMAHMCANNRLWTVRMPAGYGALCGTRRWTECCGGPGLAERTRADPSAPGRRGSDGPHMTASSSRLFGFNKLTFLTFLTTALSKPWPRFLLHGRRILVASAYGK